MIDGNTQLSIAFIFSLIGAIALVWSIMSSRQNKSEVQLMKAEETGKQKGKIEEKLDQIITKIDKLETHNSNTNIEIADLDRRLSKMEQACNFCTTSSKPKSTRRKIDTGE